MTIWWLAVMVGSLLATTVAFIWLAGRVGTGGTARKRADGNTDAEKAADEDVEHIFNDTFREELRNRGRLRFEKIIDENAMFMKQDLDLTISQLNGYMKEQVAAKLDTGFEAYAKAMQEAQELALGSLQKTAQDIEEQRTALADTLQKNLAAHEAALVKVYEKNLAEITEHYIVQALGSELDLKAQLPYIIKRMEANKQDIIKDMEL